MKKLLKRQNNKNMKIAMLSPIAWSTPPSHYGPWEYFVSTLTEGLIKNGINVTLFATRNSKTKAKLHSICEKGYEEDKSIIPKVWECLHISEVFERAKQFDIIHNNFDYLPLTYSGLVKTPVLTTIHGFSSPKILPVFKKYNKKTFYVAISKSDRSPLLDYIDTIYHGIDLTKFTFINNPKDYLLFFGRIHPDKGTKEAIEIAKKCNMKLIIAGIIQDNDYFEKEIKPHLNIKDIIYTGSADSLKRNELLGNAYVLLHPINFNEPFGLSVIESMACGTPVIAINRGSMPELIEDGRNGYLVKNINDAVNIIKKDIRYINRQDCRKSIEEKFSSEIMVGNYISVYNKIINMKK